MKFPLLDIIGRNIKAITQSLLGWLKGVTTLSYADIIKNVILAILILGVVYIALNMEVIASMSSLVIWGFAGIIIVFLIVQLILEISKSSKKKEHNQLVKEEQDIIQGKNQLNDELDSAMDKAVYRLNCARIMVHSLHNGIRAFAGLPFLRMSVIKESINSDIPDNEMVADLYQGQMISLYKFPSLLNKEEYIVASIDEMKQLDFKFACNMNMSKDSICLAIPLKNVHNTPIGFVIFGWRSEDDVPMKDGKRDCERITDEARNICSLAKAYLIVK